MRDVWRNRVQPVSLTLVLLLVVAESGLSNGQVASEYQVKAAYVYNFAKFVEWPAQDFPSATAPIRICVLNDPRFETELEHIVRAKTIAGHPVSVISVEDADQCRSCHVLFVNSSQKRQVHHIIQVLRDTNVLTVGETTGFVDEGGIINFVVQDERVTFEINRKAALQSGLRISSRLLSVAKLVIE